MIVIGKRKGADACLAILFSLLFILRVLLPALYNGHSAIGMGLVTALLTTAVTLVLLHGPTKQCLLGIGATLLGELAACVLFAVASSQFHLTGFQTDEAEGLLLIVQGTGLDIRTLLFAGIMISSVGAVMDVAVSILSALREVAIAAKAPTPGMLFRSGMNLGQDWNHEQHADFCLYGRRADHYDGILLLWDSVPSAAEFGFSGRGACAGSVQYRSRDFECSCCSRDGRGLLRKKQKTLIIK